MKDSKIIGIIIGLIIGWLILRKRAEAKELPKTEPEIPKRFEIKTVMPPPGLYIAEIKPLRQELAELYSELNRLRRRLKIV